MATCPRCNGSKTVPIPWAFAQRTGQIMRQRCPQCKGEGVIPDPRPDPRQDPDRNQATKFAQAWLNSPFGDFAT